MTYSENVRGVFCALLLIVLQAFSTAAAAAEPVLALAKQERPALLDTLKELVAIESGSSDIEGLDRIRAVIAARLAALGAKTEVIDPDVPSAKGVGVPDKIGKMVRATFTGTGTKKILLLAHMDTVYPRGMLARQPFRIDGDRAWGLGIADDKHGIAVILHALKMLNALKLRDYGVLTVLVNADEEIGSPGSRNTIVRLGGQHDVVLSFEGSSIADDQVRLATSGTAAAILKVRGRGSHAGSAPERGVNALYELAHQVLQLRDLSDSSTGLKLNWTVANAGIVRNMIPPSAEAIADIRVERVADLDGVEQKLRERIKNKLLPDSQVELDFRPSRPPLQATDASRALAAHAQQIYAEIGKKLAVRERSTGGGTDAAYAALKTTAPVVEGFGLQGFGAHSTDAEYISIPSIEPRLYLAARMIIDIAQGKTK
ncbi:MAG TPA: M20/M25/M40 family metallo-hydrolase [Burkholderiales bacterium]|nr:M20/M25/M40 family metallo-hydrolase [Burkholderiales bacterium]